MATLLHRLGGFAFRRRRLVLAVWLVVLVVVGAGSTLLKGETSGSLTIPGTESQKARDLLSVRLPAAGGASGRVIFAAPDGKKISADQQAAISKAMTTIKSSPGVVRASDPFDGGQVSDDGRVALGQVAWTQTASDLDDAQIDAVDTAADTVKSTGLEVELGGDAAKSSGGVGGTGEILGFGVAAIVLAMTFGALLAAGMPLLTSVLGVGIGLSGISAASGFFDLSSAVSTLALMLGLAVGIDYALFILSRHRAQLHDGMEPEASVALAVATAGSAVVFAGATVVIALTALVVVGIPFLAAMGIAAAATVVIAVLIAITLVPALLGFAGTRIAKGKRLDVASSRPTMGALWSGLIVRHRAIAVTGVIAVLAAIAIPALNMRTALSDDSTAAPNTTQRKGYELLSKGFGAGFNGPLTVVVDAGKGQDAAKAASTVRAKLATEPNVDSVGQPSINPAGDTATLSVIPRSGPTTTQTKNLVETVRADASALEAQTGSEVLVTGQTAVNIDVADQLSSALIPYLTVVVVLAMLLLLLVFRSLLVPLTAIGGFLLTIIAAFGATTAVFQNGFAGSLLGVDTQAPIISLLPILIIGILFGLAMDYQVFLVYRMREAYINGAEPTAAVREGFQNSARVVTAAGLIMVAVFSGFILEDDAIIKSIGFALGFGILVDAFLVRMTLIPALMSLLGHRAWWLPAWLDRIVPRVDIDGAALEPQPERPVERVLEPVA